jgi:hypothetical protein
MRLEANCQPGVHRGSRDSVASAILQTPRDGAQLCLSDGERVDGQSGSPSGFQRIERRPHLAGQQHTRWARDLPSWHHNHSNTQGFLLTHDLTHGDFMKGSGSIPPSSKHCHRCLGVLRMIGVENGRSRRLRYARSIHHELDFSRVTRSASNGRCRRGEVRTCATIQDDRAMVDSALTIDYCSLEVYRVAGHQGTRALWHRSTRSRCASRGRERDRYDQEVSSHDVAV